MSRFETHATVLQQLQGVWFPTHITNKGQLTWEGEPRFPAGHQPWLKSIVGETVHITADADYYATGGRLWIDAPGCRMVLEYPDTPLEYASRFAYRLNGNELQLAAGGFAWCGPHDVVCTTRYVRVATEPTPAMMALINSVMQSWQWEKCRAEPDAATLEATLRQLKW